MTPSLPRAEDLLTLQEIELQHAKQELESTVWTLEVEMSELGAVQPGRKIYTRPQHGHVFFLSTINPLHSKQEEHLQMTQQLATLKSEIENVSSQLERLKHKP